jgi:hypothetical protein
MIKYIISFVILLAIVMWLVLSYVPNLFGPLPAIAFSAGVMASWAPWLAAVSLLLMVAAQGWVLFTTGRALRRPPTLELAATIEHFNLRFGAEMFWTALPLVMLLLLAAVILGGRA